MDYLKEYIVNNRIYPEWWPYKVVAWYCSKRKIELPKGRCHFGEIFLFYTPAYLILGLLVKPLGLIFTPVTFATRWLIGRAKKESETHKVGLWAILIIGAIAFFTTQVLVLEYYYEDWGWITWVAIFPLMLAAFLVTCNTLFLVALAGEKIAPKFSPVADFSREAAQRIHVQPSLQAVRASIKGTASQVRHGGTVVKTLWVIAKSVWRQNVCPRVEYIAEDEQPSQSK